MSSNRSAYTGTVNRVLSEKYGEQPSVLDWGATGDGSTDDTTAFQAAINEVAGQKAVLLVPTGTYIVTSLSLPSNCTLKGENGAIIKSKASSAQEDVPFITNSAYSAGNEYIKLLNLTIDGNRANQSEAGVALIYLQHVHKMDITGCFLKNAVEECLLATNVEDITVSDCLFRNWATGNNGAMYFTAYLPSPGPISRIRITNNYVDGSVSGSSCIKLDGTLANPVKDVVISNNHVFVGGGADPQACLGIETWNDVDNFPGCENISVTGNVIEGDPASKEVWGISVTGMKGCTVTGNSIKNCLGFAIEIIGSHVSVTGNNSFHCGPILIAATAYSTSDIICSGNVHTSAIISGQTLLTRGIHIYHSNDYGVGTYELRNVVVAGNVVTVGAGETGISCQSNEIGGGIYDVIIDSNLINGVLSGEDAGITASQSAGTVTRVTISNNRINNFKYGVSIYASTSVRSIFNRFLNVTYPYPQTPVVGNLVLDIDNGSNHLVIPDLCITGQLGPTIDGNGNVVFPSEYNRVSNSNPDYDENPNLWSLTQLNCGTEWQGGLWAVNSKWAGAGNWAKSSTSAYARAMWVIMAAARFGVKFGAAANAGGAEPGDYAFYVNDPESGYPGIYCKDGSPVYLEDCETASKPLKLDANKKVVSGEIGLAAATGHVTGTLPIANGGTGATSAADARTALDVYSKAESDQATDLTDADHVKGTGLGNTHDFLGWYDGAVVGRTDEEAFNALGPFVAQAFDAYIAVWAADGLLDILANYALDNHSHGGTTTIDGTPAHDHDWST